MVPAVAVALQPHQACMLQAAEQGSAGLKRLAVGQGIAMQALDGHIAMPAQLPDKGAARGAGTDLPVLCPVCGRPAEGRITAGARVSFVQPGRASTTAPSEANTPLESTL